MIAVRAGPIRTGRGRMMIKDKLERIRDRAYALWQKAGGGHGDDEAHWHQASREIDDEDAKPAARSKRTKVTGKPTAAAKAAAKPKVSKSAAAAPAARQAKPKPAPTKAAKSPAAAERKPAATAKPKAPAKRTTKT
nr:DUF2934 domain-containing protein [Sphingomonas chungangi]